MTKTGLDQFFDKVAPLLQGKKVGLLAHPASVNSDLNHALHLLASNDGWRLTTLFGPQHGWLGNDQDNMIEWQGGKLENLYLYSLYGEHRKPTAEMLRDCQVIVVDLQDVGCRVYTFIQTLYLVMQAAAENKKQVIVLDRPNPIGNRIEGPMLNTDFATFVGFTAINLRHGLTIGELARFYRLQIECDLEVITMQGYKSNSYFDQTGLPWVFPSPNMPTLETAIVYPGAVLFEATHISEGRGTTKPFEILGAPDIKPDHFAKSLEQYNLEGVSFRPLKFTPTFHKFKDELCGGIQYHVTDRNKFQPVLAAVALLKEFKKQSKHFAWLDPPYEYEYEKMPIDILAGSDRLRNMIEFEYPLDKFADGFALDSEHFQQYLNQVDIKLY